MENRCCDGPQQQEPRPSTTKSDARIRNAAWGRRESHQRRKRSKFASQSYGDDHLGLFGPNWRLQSPVPAPHSYLSRRRIGQGRLHELLEIPDHHHTSEAKMPRDTVNHDDWVQRLSAVHYNSWEQFCNYGLSQQQLPSASQNRSEAVGDILMSAISERTVDDDGVESLNCSNSSSSISSWSSDSSHQSWAEGVGDESGVNGFVPWCALPGLNMAINMATLTSDERDLFISMAPEMLQDPCLLMDEVVKLRVEMMQSFISAPYPSPECGQKRQTKQDHAYSKRVERTHQCRAAREVVVPTSESQGDANVRRQSHQVVERRAVPTVKEECHHDFEALFEAELPVSSL